MHFSLTNICWRQIFIFISVLLQYLHMLHIYLSILVFNYPLYIYLSFWYISAIFNNLVDVTIFLLFNTRVSLSNYLEYIIHIYVTSIHYSFIYIFKPLSRISLYPRCKIHLCFMQYLLSYKNWKEF